MFSKLANHFKGSQGTLYSDREDEPCYSPHRGQAAREFSRREENGGCDVRSTVSTVSAQDKKSRKEQKKNGRNKKLSRLFASDCEDELQSVVSDNPNLYNRSISMHTLANSNKRGGLNSGHPKKLDRVEARMQAIQSSLSSSSLANNSTYATDTGQTINKKEVGMIVQLKRELEEKEKFTQRLKEQLQNQNNKNQKSDVGGDQIKNLEAQLAEKMKQIKAKKEQMKKKGAYGNIDMKISLAELEYRIEKDQIDIINLSQKIQSLRMANEKDSFVDDVGKEECLYKYITKYEITFLVAADLESAREVSCLRVRYEGIGVEVAEGLESRQLNPGDRLVELAGEPVLRILGEEWDKLAANLAFPCKAVVMRGKESSRQVAAQNPTSDVNGLRDDIAMIQSRLETKLKEGRNLSTELNSVTADKQKLQNENTRLNHRIEYLEDQVAELENGMKAVRDSLAHTLNTEIQDTITKLDAIGKAGIPMTEALFQKGGHVAHVKVPMAAVLEGLGGQQDEQLSTATSGIYSVEGSSEGSNSPESSSFRSRVDAGEKRWSSALMTDNDNQVNHGEQQRHVARMIVRDETRSEYILPPPKPSRPSQEGGGGGGEERKAKTEAVERSNSRVTARVSNLMRWPRTNKAGGEKEQVGGGQLQQTKNSFV